jgi:flagellar assembly factor FliW
MIVNTYLFGNIEINDEEILTFEHGIPGFEHLHTFAYIRESEESLFTHLQALEDGDITFIITNPFLFYPEYDFILPDSAKEELGLTGEKDVEVWSIVTLGEKVEEATMNLLAPIVANKKDKRAKQIVLQNPSYKTKHPLVQETSQPVEEKG